MSETCVVCSDREASIQHHINYERDDTVPVCGPCHDTIHMDSNHEFYPDDPENANEYHYGDSSVSKRIPLAEETRERLKDRKRGDDTYDDVIQRLLGDGADNAEFSTTAKITPTLDDEALAAVREQVESVAWGDFPTADVKEAVRDVLRDELPEGARR